MEIVVWIIRRKQVVLYVVERLLKTERQAFQKALQNVKKKRKRNDESDSDDEDSNRNQPMGNQALLWETRGACEELWSIK